MTSEACLYTYSIKEINNIIDDGFDYTLPEETLKTIEILSQKVGAPSYIKTPNFQKKYYNKNYKKHRNKGTNVTDDEWKSIREFKKTEIKKDGDNIYIEKITCLLNKLTDRIMKKKKII